MHHVWTQYADRAAEGVTLRVVHEAVEILVVAVYEECGPSGIFKAVQRFGLVARLHAGLCGVEAPAKVPKDYYDIVFSQLSGYFCKGLPPEFFRVAVDPVRVARQEYTHFHAPFMDDPCIFMGILNVILLFFRNVRFAGPQRLNFNRASTRGARRWHLILLSALSLRAAIYKSFRRVWEAGEVEVKVGGQNVSLRVAGGIAFAGARFCEEEGWIFRLALDV